jgi:hypothetical protein
MFICLLYQILEQQFRLHRSIPVSIFCLLESKYHGAFSLRFKVLGFVKKNTIDGHWRAWPQNRVERVSYVGLNNNLIGGWLEYRRNHRVARSTLLAVATSWQNHKQRIFEFTKLYNDWPFRLGFIQYVPGKGWGLFYLKILDHFAILFILCNGTNWLLDLVFGSKLRIIPNNCCVSHHDEHIWTCGVNVDFVLDRRLTNCLSST